VAELAWKVAPALATVTEDHKFDRSTFWPFVPFGEAGEGEYHGDVSEKMERRVGGSFVPRAWG
jgi:hypothetical protein